jgi:hypothetical protein
MRMNDFMVRVQNMPDSLLSDLIVELKTLLPEGNWHAERISGGVESSAAVLYGPGSSKRFLKYSPSRKTANDNDPDLDLLDLYTQDRRIALLCLEAGLPVPRPYAVLESVAGMPVMLMEHIDHDYTSPDEIEFGRLARKIHMLPVSGGTTVAMRGKDIAKVVCELTCNRLDVVLALSGRNFPRISSMRLEQLLRPLGKKHNLLHMDLRFENVLCRKGKPSAVIDWANSLIGDPIVEIARIYEYGLLSANFCKGYGDLRLLETLDTPIGMACRLYTATMMCVLFLSEIPNEAEAEKRLDGLRRLLEDIEPHVGSFN